MQLGQGGAAARDRRGRWQQAGRSGTKPIFRGHRCTDGANPMRPPALGALRPQWRVPCPGAVQAAPSPQSRRAPPRSCRSRHPQRPHASPRPACFCFCPPAPSSNRPPRPRTRPAHPPELPMGASTLLLPAWLSRGEDSPSLTVRSRRGASGGRSRSGRRRRSARPRRRNVSSATEQPASADGARWLCGGGAEVNRRSPLRPYAPARATAAAATGRAPRAAAPCCACVRVCT